MKLLRFFLTILVFPATWLPAQSFLNPSLENWGDPTLCNVNSAPDGWDNFSNEGQSFDEANFALCPTTVPSAAADGNTYGRAYVEDVNSGEGIAQTVNGFTPGNAYEVSFDYAGSNLFPGSNDVLWQIHLDGQLADATAAVSSSEATWQQHTFTFTATSPVHTLGFRAVTANNLSSGSAGIDNFSISVLPIDAEDPVSNFDQSSSEICSNGCVVFTNTSQFHDGVTWFFEGGSPAQSSASGEVTVCYSQPGVFSVALVATNAVGIDEIVISDAVTVVDSPAGELHLIGDSLVLETDGTVTSLQWSLDGVHLVQNASVVTPAAPGLYELALQNAFGCTAFISLFVEDETTTGGEPHDHGAVEQGEDLDIFIPNAITMDENGLNDAWITYGDKANWEEFHAIIFNRWGEVVFESSDPDRYWIGDVQGGAHYVQDGIFNYIVRVRPSSKATAKQYRGHIVVIR